MKRLLLLFICSASIICFSQKTTMYVAARTGLSIREKQDAASKVLDKIPFGTKITLPESTEEEQTIKTEGITGHWKKVSYNGKTGYIIDSYLFPMPVPKSTVKDLKAYILQNTQPFGSKLIVKHGTMGNIEESGYEIRKQLYKNGAEMAELFGYEYGATTYIIPDFNMQQGFLLLRMIPEFKEVFGDKEEFPNESRTYKKGEIEYTVTVDKEAMGEGTYWVKKITVEYSDGATYDFEMFEMNNEIVITLSSGV